MPQPPEAFVLEAEHQALPFQAEGGVPGLDRQVVPLRGGLASRDAISKGVVVLDSSRGGHLDGQEVRGEPWGDWRRDNGGCDDFLKATFAIQSISNDGSQEVLVVPEGLGSLNVRETEVDQNRADVLVLPLDGSCVRRPSIVCRVRLRARLL